MQSSLTAPPALPQWIYPFASAIDTPLPAPPTTVHLMLKFKVGLPARGAVACRHANKLRPPAHQCARPPVESNFCIETNFCNKFLQADWVTPQARCAATALRLHS